MSSCLGCGGQLSIPPGRFCSLCGAPTPSSASLKAGDSPPTRAPPIPPLDADEDAKDSAFEDLADNPFGDEDAALRAPPVPARPPLPLRKMSPRSAAPAALSPAEPEDTLPAHRARLIAFYQMHNPSKLRDPSFNADATLLAYRGREHQLFADLEHKYSADGLSSSASVPYAPGGVPAPSPSPPPPSRPFTQQPQQPQRPPVQVPRSASVPPAPGDLHVPTIIDGLKLMYRTKVKPVEQTFKFHEFNSPLLTDTDLEAKPMVLLLGACFAALCRHTIVLACSSNVRLLCSLFRPILDWQDDLHPVPVGAGLSRRSHWTRAYNGLPIRGSSGFMSALN